MDDNDLDLPPPPYSPEDPHRSTTPQPFNPEPIQSFNASIPSPPATVTSGFFLHHGLSATPSPSSQAGPSRSPIIPILTPPSTTTNTPPPPNPDELRKSGFVSALPYFELRSLTHTNAVSWPPSTDGRVEPPAASHARSRRLPATRGYRFST